jgi:2-keto-4-pentenoate hydratase
MDQDATERAAGYLAEAFETGNPLAPLPEGLAPGDLAAAEAVAEALLDRLGLVPCGLRLALGPGGTMLAGPMLDTRLLREGTPVSLGALRHARMSAAVVGVLAAPLDADGTQAPRFAAVHPALDLAGSRFRDGPADDAACAADLAGLGYVLAGRAGLLPDGAAAIACAEGAARPRGHPVELAAAFAAAAAEARRLGGLPAGALLVVAGLTPPVAPQAGQDWTARIAGLGRARASLVAPIDPGA